VKAWLRHLLGQDVNPPEYLPDEFLAERPVALIGQSFFRERRYWELGGLDLEIAKLLLDLRVHDGGPKELEELAAIWAAEPGAQIQIHPFLDAIKTWGPRLPASIVQAASRQLSALGLEFVKTSTGKKPNSDWLGARATGERFHVQQVDSRIRQQVLRDALAIGGGYAELVSSRGVVLKCIQNRLVDLDRGIIGPRKAVPRYFSRHDIRGQCAMCAGSGVVMAFSEKLVVRSCRAKPSEEDFLHPAASAIMKGVRRSILLPFLRRMEDEGLWGASHSFERLDESQQALLLYGFWHRPGHGTFLKESKADPSEVGSWLRWDGLYRHLAEQLDRSEDAKWKAAVEASRKNVRCSDCSGTGLAAHADLLKLGGRSLKQWVLGGVHKEFIDALNDLQVISRRQQRTKERIVYCLAPLLRETGDCSLVEPAGGVPAQEVSGQIVGMFSDMPPVFQ